MILHWKVASCIYSATVQFDELLEEWEQGRNVIG